MNNTKNLKLYPKYRRLAMDFLFFYTINVLFLTQVKHIAMSSVVLVDTFYSLFVVIAQIPMTILVRKVGIKKGAVLGNICNAIYLILVINSTNLFNLICAELACAMGFALKEICEPAILNESINLKKQEKSKLFSKIQGKAVSGYYLLSAISMILSGFLFEINGYIPLFISLFIILVTLAMSTKFDELENESIKKEKTSISFKEAMSFCFKSNRCKSLLIFSGCFYGIMTVLATYEIGLLEELNIYARYTGIIFAVLNIISALSSKFENIFQEKFKNRTLTLIGMALVISFIIAGCITTLKVPFWLMISIILLMYAIKYITVGLYQVFLLKYLSNFTNKEIDTQIFSLNSFIGSISGVIFGLLGAFLTEKSSIAESMMIFGVVALILMIIILIYMKTRVGLKPEEYSELELKYDMKV